MSDLGPVELLLLYESCVRPKPNPAEAHQPSSSKPLVFHQTTAIKQPSFRVDKERVFIFGKDVGDPVPLAEQSPTLIYGKECAHLWCPLLLFYEFILFCVFIFEGITNKFNFNTVNPHIYLLRAISWHLNEIHTIES